MKNKEKRRTALPSQLSTLNPPQPQMAEIAIVLLLVLVIEFHE